MTSGDSTSVVERSKKEEEKISIVPNASIKVNGAFPKPEVMLPTLYQQYIHLSRYSRYRYVDNRRETWEETVSRYFDFFVSSSSAGFF